MPHDPELSKFKNRRTLTGTVDPEVFKSFKSNLASFVSICKHRNINLILMTQFNRFTLDDDFVRGVFESSNPPVTYESYIESYSVFNDIIRNVASTQNLQLIDLDSLVPHNRTYIYDPVHLTDSGSVFVSGIIIDALKNKYK